MVVVGVLDPDPERFRATAVHAVVPRERRRHAQSHAQHAACDWLDAGFDVDDRDLLGAPFHIDADMDVVQQMACQQHAQ